MTGSIVSWDEKSRDRGERLKRRNLALSPSPPNAGAVTHAGMHVRQVQFRAIAFCFGPSAA
jgi:hypothetical protein